MGYCYLSLITDAYSKKVVGYHLGSSLEAQNSIEALKMAIKSRKTKENLIHHSDRGIQYCSKDYVKMLNKDGIQISMAESGSPYDNAIAERVNGILKNELLIDKSSSNITEAKAHLKQAIEIYNNRRPHLSCEMLTPNAAHNTKESFKRMWKTYPRHISNIINDLDCLSTFQQKEKK